MKKSLFTTTLLALLLMCGGVAKGQYTLTTYPSKEWHIVKYGFGHHTHSVISTGSDTMINSVLSSQLYENGEYVGAYYTNGDKCFFVDTLGNASLLYDYGLQPGDTALWIPILNAGDGENQILVVDSVSTVQVNGESKKVLLFKPISGMFFNYIEECWIEDIGSLHGFLYPTHFRLLEVEAGQKCDLTCYFQENNLFWMNPDFSECGAVVPGYEKEEMLLYPNPATDVLNVVMPERIISEKVFCDIIDTHGKLVKKEVLHGSNHVRLDISTLSAGHYIMHFYDLSTLNQSVKVVKQ